MKKKTISNIYIFFLTRKMTRSGAHTSDINDFPNYTYAFNHYSSVLHSGFLSVYVYVKVKAMNVNVQGFRFLCCL